jgi:replicative DNA helicase
LPSLREACPGVGPALFTILAARPECGKTALWVHFVAGPDGFAEQGAKIDIYVNEEPAIRTQMRAVSSFTGMTEAEIRNDIPRAKVMWDKIKGNINIFDSVGLTIDELDARVAKRHPDIVIVDTLDKVHSTSNKDARDHEKLRAVYTGAREIAKRRNTAFVAISQLSIDAQDKRNVDYSMLEGSKTGKGAEADAILCMGARDEPGKELYRQINLTKNKITGRHDAINVKLNPLISRYTI